MLMTYQLERAKVRMKSKEITVVVLQQKDINVEIKEELGRILLMDAADCQEMFLLSSLFRHSMQSHDVIFLERDKDSNMDVFIFNGAIHPLTMKDLRKIKASTRFTKTELYRLTLENSHDDSMWDTWEHWKYEEQLRIKTDQDIGVINASQLGLELLFHQCAYLASSFTGHSHMDWNSTQSSIELIIRNIARND
ncbi:hypothetical protein J2W91_002094 [Paenibacillus amylolyticus]|uniref:Uncharacterized protein n=1 Tax=Paenibacillus amylolyticus TaxID=1451 RepID=A0AAP5H0P2_PAEAM|nr:hypothetical protein [Paenibacillus amylolyticus]MDR6723632.1 hypothetical protein [Paenibacillus amylolyticus]